MDYTHVVKIYTSLVTNIAVSVFDYDIEHVVRSDAHMNVYIKTNDPHGARIEIEKGGLGGDIYTKEQWEDFDQRIEKITEEGPRGCWGVDD